MEWDQYLRNVLEKERVLDNIPISIESHVVDLPQIVKASVYLLEKMIRNQGSRNVFVFPDGEQIPFLFMIAKLIYNILVGKVENEYSPDRFNVGQTLKLKNCVMQFLGIEEVDGKKRICLRFSDTHKYSSPLSMAPYLQISDTKKRLSTLAAYHKAKEIVEEEIKMQNRGLSDIKAVKTHVKNSIFYVSTVAHSERLADEIKIDGEKIYEYFLSAKVDYMGKMKKYKGKLDGVPSLIFASQISHVVESIQKGACVQSVIINLKECDVNEQLDALDELISIKFPILCIADTLSSFALDELENRKFNVWRWDSESITNTVNNRVTTLAEKKIGNCVNAKVIYHSIYAPAISEAFSILYKYNKEIENEAAQINSLYEKLLSISDFLVKNIYEIGEQKKADFKYSIEECAQKLIFEKAFLDEQLYEDFSRAIKLLLQLFEMKSISPKSEELYKLIMCNRYESFYIICSNRDNSELIKEYWTKKFSQSGYRPTIRVVYAKEFLGMNILHTDVVFVTSWYSGKVLQRIIYGYKVEEIHIFTYECEERWKLAHTKVWKKQLSNSRNRIIAKQAFSEQANQIVEIVTNEEQTEKLSKEDKESIELQDDLDLIIQEHKYRRYCAKETGYGKEIVCAKPVGFVGGDFALYTTGHKIISVTKLIMQAGKQIEKQEVDDLKLGDFIVIRESSKDLIREVADDILKANGNFEYRKTVNIWKDALKIEEALSSVGDIYRKLRDMGCRKNMMTVKNWLTSEDIIIPQDKKDLEYIAEMTGDIVLAEKIDEIVDAGNYIRSAHIEAGKILSKRLTEIIAIRLLGEDLIDPFNIWDPIDIEIEDVGTAKLLKIIDIGQEWLKVESINTNRLLSENKENLLWQK